MAKVTNCSRDMARQPTPRPGARDTALQRIKNYHTTINKLELLEITPVMP